MTPKRYTIVIADRTTGVVHRFRLSLRPTVTAIALIFALPVLVGLGARWSALAEVSGLRSTAATLQLQNDAFRTMTRDLESQIQGVQAAVDDLGTRAPLDSESARLLAKLPQIVRSRAMGGGNLETPVTRKVLAPTLQSPDDTFGVLASLLGKLASRLEVVQGDVERRDALLSATPSMWPTIGPLSATWGVRDDPFGGPARATHAGIDISADRGAPVYATADGVVVSAGWLGDYGNLVVIDHHFGLETRYAHLSNYTVRPGDRVQRGSVIGHVGSTGRVTGPHLHYEYLVNGQLTNPLLLLSTTRRP